MFASLVSVSKVILFKIYENKNSPRCRGELTLSLIAVLSGFPS